MNKSQKDGLTKFDAKLERVSLSEARDMIYEKFRTNIRILRAHKGLSGVEASEGIGLRNGKRMIDLEYGRCSPTMEEMLLISKYFNVPIDHLLHNQAKVTFI